jgi:hypothetical protein
VADRRARDLGHADRLTALTALPPPLGPHKCSRRADESAQRRLLAALHKLVECEMPALVLLDVGFSRSSYLPAIGDLMPYLEQRTHGAPPVDTESDLRVFRPHDNFAISDADLVQHGNGDWHHLPYTNLLLYATCILLSRATKSMSIFAMPL